jgi:hypothetical protein
MIAAVNEAVFFPAFQKTYVSFAVTATFGDLALLSLSTKLCNDARTSSTHNGIAPEWLPDRVGDFFAMHEPIMMACKL